MPDTHKVTIVNARDLARKTAHILDAVEQTGQPAVVIRNGRPVAALVPIDESELEDFVLAKAPEYVRGMKEANAALAAGAARDADDFFAELDAQA